jgi:hypothetical protein
MRSWFIFEARAVELFVLLCGLKLFGNPSAQSDI